MISVRPSVVSLRAGDEMKLEFYLESSSLKISSLSTTAALRGMSSISIASSRDDYESPATLLDPSSNPLAGLDESKAT
jgi:hypothetical protein